jgi:hypothetical protein
MRRVTDKPWFGPKLLGWGWRPIPWQGWLLTLLLTVLVVGVRIAFGTSLLAFGLGAALILGFALIAWRMAGPPRSSWRR